MFIISCLNMNAKMKMSYFNFIINFITKLNNTAFTCITWVLKNCNYCIHMSLERLYLNHSVLKRLFRQWGITLIYVHILSKWWYETNDNKNETMWTKLLNIISSNTFLYFIFVSIWLAIYFSLIMWYERSSPNDIHIYMKHWNNSKHTQSTLLPYSLPKNIVWRLILYRCSTLFTKTHLKCFT